tara:strand:- start:171 stop:350 length:180 start_codon:yes stop_codon:yes gene_type:complete
MQRREREKNQKKKQSERVRANGRTEVIVAVRFVRALCHVVMGIVATIRQTPRTESTGAT